MVEVTTLVPITAHVVEKRNDYGEITQLDMTDKMLRDHHIHEYMAKTSKDHENVDSIYIRYESKITHVGLRALEKMFVNPYQVSTLDMGGITMRSEEIHWLQDIISNPSSLLTSLEITLDCQSMEMFGLVSQALSSPSCRITRLRIHLGFVGVIMDFESFCDRFSKEVAAFMYNNKSIHYLRLSRFPFQNHHIREIGTSLKQNRTLTHLMIFGGCTDNEGCQTILEALHINNTLTHLIMRCNVRNIDPWIDAIHTNAMIDSIGLYGDPTYPTYDIDHPLLVGLNTNRMHKRRIKSIIMATGIQNPKIGISLFKRLVWQK